MKPNKMKKTVLEYQMKIRHGPRWKTGRCSSEKIFFTSEFFISVDHLLN